MIIRDFKRAYISMKNVLCSCLVSCPVTLAVYEIASSTRNGEQMADDMV